MTGEIIKFMPDHKTFRMNDIISLQPKDLYK